jgi:hypothetical protein
MKGIITICLLCVAAMARAGDVEIKQVVLQQSGEDWSARVTLKHGDTGWDHYADGWRVVSPDGEVLGHRTLHHPHVNEQPFTRGLSGITIPARLDEVVVEAHDKVHGWSPDRVHINMHSEQGDRYRVERR